MTGTARTYRIGGIVALAVIAVVVAVVLIGRPSSKLDPIKIGIVLPLSGSMAEYGQNAKDGLTLAHEELERVRDMKAVSLLYQDTKDAPQDTVAAVRRLIDVDNVRFIIGGLTSSGVLAAAPYAQQHGVLFFTPAASAPGIPEIGDLVFRNWPPDDAMSKKFGDAIFKRGVRKVAILSVSNDYGETNAKGFASSFEAAGGAIIFRRSFAQGTTDFRSLVAQASALQNLDRLLIIGYPDEYRAFFQELAKSSIKPDVVLTSDTFYSPNLVNEVGQLAEGAITAVAAKPGDTYAPRKAFIEAYGNRFKAPSGQPKTPGLVGDTAYDALKMVVSAISKTDGSPTAVAKYLRDIKNYPGAAGPTTFTAAGDIDGDLALYQVRMGKFVQLEL
jgi:branched-chain amino acid transport system substrate-binding protein